MRKLGQSYSNANVEVADRRSRSQDVPPYVYSAESDTRRDSTLPSTSRRRLVFQTQNTSSSSRPHHSGFERSTSIRDRASHFFGIDAPDEDVAWQRRRLRHLHLAYGVKPNKVSVVPSSSKTVQNNRNETRQSRSRSASNADQVDVLGAIVDGLPSTNGPTTDKARISRAFSIGNYNAPADHRDSALKIAVDAVTRFARGQSSTSKATRSTLSRYQGTRQSGSISRNHGLSFLPNPYLENEFIPAQPKPTILGSIAETSFISNVMDRPNDLSGSTPPIAQRSVSIRDPSEPHPPPRRSRTRPDTLNLLGHSEMSLIRGRLPGGRDFFESLLNPHPLSPVFDETTPSESNETFFMSPEAEKFKKLFVSTEGVAENNAAATSEPSVTSEIGASENTLKSINEVESVAKTSRGPSVTNKGAGSEGNARLFRGSTVLRRSMTLESITFDDIAAEEGTITPPFPLVSPEGPSEFPPLPPLTARPIQTHLIIKQRAISNLDSNTEEISCFEYLRKSFKEKMPGESFNLETLIKNRHKKKRPTLPLGVEFAKKKKAFIEKQLNDPTYDYRPLFTYWITAVQIIVTIMSLFYFGFGPVNIGVTHRSGDVMAASLSIVHIDVMELANFWLGPRYEDLIQMGAKYTPCMRRDLRIMLQIEQDRKTEAQETGCCWSQQPSSSKTSGDCYQTSDCPTQISKQFMYANKSAGIRAVCGQDPRYCRHSETWGKDISKWPPCAAPITQYSRNDVHMTCRIRGRPCCIQLHGQCRITTREYCNFVHGTYHENATLCSQVSCLSDVCGMVPFIRPEYPDQIIRFVTPLFIHAGIIQLVITVWLQIYYMKLFENMIGTARIVLIYFCSGICGYLASATFVPYLPQVGPAGAHSGILGALTVNIVYNWNLIREPAKAMACHLLVAGIMFLVGFLPYIDNVGQVVGFIVGSVLAGALIPYFGVSRKVRVLTSVFCLLATIVIFIILITLFVLKDSAQLIDISALTCFELSLEGICDQQSLKLRDWLPI